MGALPWTGPEPQTLTFLALSHFKNDLLPLGREEKKEMEGKGILGSKGNVRRTSCAFPNWEREALAEDGFLQRKRPGPSGAL